MTGTSAGLANKLKEWISYMVNAYYYGNTQFHPNLAHPSQVAIKVIKITTITSQNK